MKDPRHRAAGSPGQGKEARGRRSRVASLCCSANSAKEKVQGARAEVAPARDSEPEQGMDRPGPGPDLEGDRDGDQVCRGAGGEGRAGGVEARPSRVEAEKELGVRCTEGRLAVEARQSLRETDGELVGRVKQELGLSTVSRT